MTYRRDVTDVQQQAPAAALGTADPESVARAYNLRRSGARPPLGRYLGELWERRHFIVSYSRASSASNYAGTILGQLWQILTPLLNAAVYYLIFGLLLHTKRGVPNFTAFLIIGMFIFHFMSKVVSSAASVVPSSMNLVRTLRFPRASLPLGMTAIGVQRLMLSLIVLIPIVLITGEPVSWTWLTLIPAAALCSIFTLGLSFIIARVGAKIPDTTQFLPFILRTWLFASGIFYNIDKFANNHTVYVLLHYQPGAVYVDLARGALLQSQHSTSKDWIAGVVWAVVTVVFGLIYFWRGEEGYGRG
jgi:teichoic acid transport system permease protein